MREPQRRRPKSQASQSVRRELNVSEAQSQPGVLATSTILAFAEELIDAGDSHTVLDVKMTVFMQSRSASVSGEAVVIFSRDQIVVWETNVTELNGEPVARVVHTLISGSALGVGRPETDGAVQLSAKDKKAVASLGERRQTIAEAASRVIANKGFAASSIREIADAAGMHVPTMYQYVSSKDEVLELVYLSAIKQVRESVADAIGSSASPKQRLVAVTLRLLDDNDKMRRHTGVLNRELRSLSKGARNRVLGEYAEIMRSIAKVIEDGIELGQFRKVNPIIAANFIDALCDMWALRQFAVGQFSVDEYREEALKQIQEGFFLS